MTDDGRLNGWKAIGNYLGRDRTTAIRWSRERGLPVHRVPGGRTGTVYAIAGELDGWLADGGAALPPQAPGLPPPPPPATPSPTAAAPARPRRWAAVAVAGGAAAAVAAVGVSMWRLPAHAAPLGIAAVTSPQDNAPAQRFARDLTADLARFANASPGLAVYDQRGGERGKVAYQVHAAVDGAAPRLVARVWLTAARDGTVLWSRRVEQSTPELSLLRERVAAYVVGIARCGIQGLAEQRTELAPSDIAPLLATCQALLDDDFDLAATHARAFVAAHPELAIGWAILASIQAEIENSGGDPALRRLAKANAAKAMAIAPDSRAARLSVVFALGGSEPSTLPVVERALRDDPDNPDLLRPWSVMLFNAGYVRASVQPAIRAVDSDPTWLGGRDIAVRRLAAAGRLDEAWQLQRDNERLWPGHPALIVQHRLLLEEADQPTKAGQSRIAPAASGRGARRPDVSGAVDDATQRWAKGDASAAYALARSAERRGDRTAALAWLARAPVGPAAHQQWAMLFWPSVAGLRTDPAFFRKMAALGLVRIWRARRQWPDFCAEPGLTYDCAAEAARLATPSG